MVKDKIGANHFNKISKVNDNKLYGYVNDELILETEDSSNVLNYGGIGFITEDGTMCSNEIQIS